MAWEIMGTGHLTGGAWGPGCTGICPYVAYPHPDCAKHGDPAPCSETRA
jgi:hypothetical protein